MLSLIHSLKTLKMNSVAKETNTQESSKNNKMPGTYPTERCDNDIDDPYFKSPRFFEFLRSNPDIREKSWFNTEKKQKRKPPFKIIREKNNNIQ